jgi:acetyltransferase
MSVLNLNRVINPATVAVVGASAAKGSVGAVIMSNMVQCGFKGDIFPVNPKYDTVMGIDACPDAADLPDGIDMAVIAVPIEKVPDILVTCSQKHMGGAVIISAGDELAGDKPAGDPAQKIRNRIKKISDRTGLRIIGPGSVGVMNAALGLNANFMHQTPVPGKIAFLSQSGAVCTAVLDMAMRENIGFSHFISLGSMADVGFADMIDFFGSSYEVESIIMVVENLTHIRNFMSAARAGSRVKPIIVMKSDWSGPDRSMGGDDVYNALFKRAGILRVKEFEALFDCAKFLARQPRPRGPKLAIISNAAGIGVMAKDALAGHGFKPAELSRRTMDALEQLLKENWSRTNPIDLSGIPRVSQYTAAVKICMAAPEIDGLLLLSSPVGTHDSTGLAKDLAGFLKTSPCPVFTAWMGGLDLDQSRTIFNRAGIVTYETPERAVRAFLNLYQYGKNLEILQEIPCRTDKRLEIRKFEARDIVDKALAHRGGILPDQTAKDLLMSYGIPVDPGMDPASSDYELIIQAIQYQDFGPVIRFGLGGVLTDVFRDMSTALPPLSRLLAATAIEETRISRVFQGGRGIQKLDTAMLEETLIRLSRLVTDFPEIKFLEMNPVRVVNGRISAAGIRVMVEKTDIKSPAHLVISPYPYWQETSFTVKDDEPVFVRPVRPSDAPQMIELFYDLSPETIYLRFFSPIKRISRSMLIRMTQIDYDREIALIAFSGSSSAGKIVGVARIIFVLNQKKGEFSIVLADKWHKKGLAAKLLGHALACARECGLEQVWGPVMTTNTAMLGLGEKLGFRVARDPDSSEYKLTIDLNGLNPLIHRT